MKNWIDKRPPDWEVEKFHCCMQLTEGGGTYKDVYEVFEAGADAMYKATLKERPCKKEWRLRILDIEFGEMSVPEFLEWVKGKSLVEENSMEFGMDDKVLINTIENEDEARAFIKFLESETLRHFRDIREARALIKEMREWIKERSIKNQ